MPTMRELIADRLLETGVRLGAERELMTRTLRVAARSPRDYERAAGYLMLAGCVDTAMVWLSARLRPARRDAIRPSSRSG